MKNSQPILLAICTACLTLLSFPVQADARRSAIPANPSPGAVGFHHRGAMSKADTALSIAFDEYLQHTAVAHKSRGRPFELSNPFLRFVKGRIAIDARASVSGAILEADLRHLGLTNSQRYGDIVSGLIPIARIDRAVALDSLRSISASHPPVRNMASITSQGDIALRADVARSNYAVDGTGIAIGVVSDSFDMLGGAAADVASGDLPSSVTVIGGESPLCNTLIFCVDEGRAILQIAHDMAPGADLLFHSGLDGKASYANAIATLAAAGADVIVDDLLFLNEPMFQDGIVAQAIDSVAAGGVIYYSAAGNQRRQSYESPFSDSGEIFCIEFFEPYDDCNEQFELVGTMHDFDPGPGEDFYQHITIPLDSALTVAMQWDQPFGGPGAVTDHDIVLLDETGATYFTISANDNVITGEGWEALQFINAAELGHGTEFSIIITYDGIDSSPNPPATLVKLVFFGEGIVIHDFPTDSSTLFGHANAAGAEAVGAAFFEQTPEYGTSPPVLEPFSSAGGTPIIFDTSGVALTSPEFRLKPEITAVDGVNTTFFFDDSHGNDGVDDFFGTSAAAPHAAGIAALMLEAQPLATPAQVNKALETTAIDMGPAGFDHDSGYGLIQADLAIASLVQDIDFDGIDDIFDNCIDVPNGPDILDAGGNSQLDTNADGYGNACDADLNNDGVVNGLDVGVFTAEFGTAGPDADFNGDGVVNGLDVGVFVDSFGTAPGPSGRVL